MSYKQTSRIATCTQILVRSVTSGGRAYSVARHRRCPLWCACTAGSCSRVADTTAGTHTVFFVRRTITRMCVLKLRTSTSGEITYSTRHRRIRRMDTLATMTNRIGPGCLKGLPRIAIGCKATPWHQDMIRLIAALSDLIIFRPTTRVWGRPDIQK